MTAKFIVLEGLEGAGKTTALKFITAWLQQQQIEVVSTREPGGTVIAEKIRTLVKQAVANEPLTLMSELLLMYAARVQNTDVIIKPALAQGKWVISDRYFLSSFAYQGGGRQLEIAAIQAIHQACLGEFKPDLTLYFDIEPELGLSRAKGRGALDRFEQQHLDFFIRTRQVYQKCLAKDDTIVEINAGLAIEQVNAQLIKALQTLLLSLQSQLQP